MNFNFYIFGNPDGQYNQYPQDYTKDILEPLCNDLQGARGVIYRHLDLVHYVYIENLEENQYIGICLIFNSVRARNIKNLFEFLRSVIENQALKAQKYIRYSSTGGISFTTSAFSEDKKTYDYLKSFINTNLDDNDNFGLENIKAKFNGANKTQYIEWTEQNKVILRLTDTCNKVVIEDDLGIKKNDTHQVISSLRSKINEQEDIIKELNRNKTDLEKQKKQYRNVVILAILVLCCCLGIYSLNHSLNKTETNLIKRTKELKEANNVISDNRVSLSKNADSISYLHEQVSDLKTSLENETRLKEDAEKIIDELNDWKPFYIIGGSFSFGDSDYTCNYVALQSKECKLRIKVFDESTDDWIVSKEITRNIEKGEGSFTVHIDRRLNSSIFYTFEIWDDDDRNLIGGSRH